MQFGEVEGGWEIGAEAITLELQNVWKLAALLDTPLIQ